MKKLKVSVLFMFLHASMELFGFLIAARTLILYGFPTSAIYAFPFPDGEIKTLFLGISGLIFAASRIIAGIGVLRNRKWGLSLGIINSIIAMVLIVFMLPMGIIDGICSLVVLVLLLSVYHGNQQIIVKE
jgi:uncharacterized membrane protein (UPF0136 family)